jgi:hypothetical protein
MFLDVTTIVAAVPLAAATTAETSPAMSAVFIGPTPFPALLKASAYRFAAASNSAYDWFVRCV